MVQRLLGNEDNVVDIEIPSTHDATQQSNGYIDSWPEWVKIR